MIRINSDWREERVRSISAIFSNRDHTPLKIRLLIDFLEVEFKE